MPNGINEQLRSDGISVVILNKIVDTIPEAYNNHLNKSQSIRISHHVLMKPIYW